jgi:hypothetical protein
MGTVAFQALDCKRLQPFAKAGVSRRKFTEQDEFSLGVSAKIADRAFPHGSY